jgi:hypothetical protein
MFVLYRIYICGHPRPDKGELYIFIYVFDVHTSQETYYGNPQLVAGIALYCYI